MSSKSAIVFIDGNNLYHNVKAYRFKPSDIDLNKLVYFIAQKFGLEVIDILYYNSTPDIRDGEIMYYRHLAYLSNLEKQGIKVVTRKLQTTSTKDLKRERIIQIDSLDLCPQCKPIIKQNFLDVLGSTQKKEKGIDILIAINMIKKCIIDNECDCCILITGDADFIPAMQIIKSAGKEVITSMTSIGYSRELRNGEFRYYLVKRSDLTDCMKDFKEVKDI